LVKAAVMNAPLDPLKICDFPNPRLEKGAVLLQTIASEVCGTDLHLYKGHLPEVPYPIIPGHVSVGVVESIKGKIVDQTGNNIDEGDTVTFLDVNETCNNCWYCLIAKTATKCPYRKVYGITYSAKEPPYLLGGWAEKIYLKPGVKIIKIPDNLKPLSFMAGGCALPTAIHAIDRANIRFGDTVAIQGCGPVGLWLTILAKYNGAFKTALLGSPSLRLSFGKMVGSDLTIDIKDFGPKERVSRVLDISEGRGADITFEATGSPTAITEGFEMTREGSKYIILGQYTNAGNIEINPHIHINKKHLEINGVWGTDFSHLYRAVDFLSIIQGKIPLDKFITNIYSIKDAQKGIEALEKLTTIKTIIKP
jgi:threonine dehydrogenase-like Zn-dependent dehydrogenase